jgi:hypothetical protein
MPLSFKPFAELDSADLQRLVQNEVPESVRIDYKRQTYGANASREFLKDVSALANTQGGYLLLGVEEADGLPTKVCGVPREGIDMHIQRMESLMRDGLEPRIIGTSIKRISVSSDSDVIAAYVPRSMSAPHRVVAQGINRFYVRNSNGNHEADLDELKFLFDRGAATTERIRRFVDHRREPIFSGEDYVEDLGPGRLVVHIVNVPTFGDSTFVDVRALFKDPYRFGPSGAGSLTRRMQLEGILVGATEGGKFDSRTVLFRDGLMEFVYTDLHHMYRERLTISGIDLSKSLVEAATLGSGLN